MNFYTFNINKHMKCGKVYTTTDDTWRVTATATLVHKVSGDREFNL